MIIGNDEREDDATRYHSRGRGFERCQPNSLTVFEPVLADQAGFKILGHAPVLEGRVIRPKKAATTFGYPFLIWTTGGAAIGYMSPSAHPPMTRATCRRSFGGRR